MDLRHGHFLVKMYVKTKELGPVGGGIRQKILYVDPPMPYYTVILYLGTIPGEGALRFGSLIVLYLTLHFDLISIQEYC